MNLFVINTDLKDDAEVDAVLEMVDRICWLLSLACMSRVMRYGLGYCAQSFKGIGVSRQKK